MGKDVEDALARARKRAKTTSAEAKLPTIDSQKTLIYGESGPENDLILTRWDFQHMCSPKV